jgi:acetoacetate decarboxylase
MMNYVPKTVDDVIVKSAWTQPVNIASAAGLIVMVAGLLKVDIDQNMATSIVLGASAAVHVFVIIRKTWFSKTVTPAVAKKM